MATGDGNVWCWPLSLMSGLKGSAQMHAGKRAIEVTRIKITDAGRQALDD